MSAAGFGAKAPNNKAGATAHATRLRAARLTAFSALLILQTLRQYIPYPPLGTAAGIAAFAAWAAALTGSDKASTMLSLIMVAAGTVLFAQTGVTPLTAIVSFGENAGVLLVMVLVPLVGIVINLGGYADALGELSKDVRRPSYLYAISLLLGYAIGSVLLNASIALLWAVLAPIVVSAGKDPADFLSSSLPRGYNASLVWTPSSPAMAVALGLTGVAWASVFWPGVVLSALLLAVAAIVELRGPLLKPAAGFGKRTASGADKKTALKKALALSAGLASFIFAIVIIQSLGYTVFQAMIPCIGATLFIWGTLIGKGRETLEASLSFFSEKMPALSNQFLLMTTAGFIGTALRTALPKAILGAARGLNPGVFIITLTASFLVWAISIAGIHALIGMTIVYPLVSPFAQGLSPVHLCLTLLLGSSLGFSISPVSATILVTSSCAGRNSVEVGPKKQWRFVAAAWIAGSLLLCLLPV